MVFFGILLMLIYWQGMGWDSLEQVGNTIGAEFFMCVSAFMNNYFGVILVFQTERPVFLREQANKMYGVFPYYMGKMIIELPPLFLGPLVLQLTTYWTLGFYKGETAFWGFYLSLCLIAQCAAAAGYFISSAFS